MIIEREEEKDDKYKRKKINDIINLENILSLYIMQIFERCAVK